MTITATGPPVSTLEMGGIQFRYEIGWDGRPLLGRLVALDTETSLAEFPEIPDLALASACDGRRNVLIHSDQLCNFIKAHADHDLVFQNCSFDYWVIHQFLTVRGDTGTLDTWDSFVRTHRMRDTMLLDMLLRLAGDSGPAGDGDMAEIAPRSLEAIGKDYLGIVIDKDSPYRKRFGELIGRSWDGVDPGFFEYAAADAISTYLVYREQAERARQVMAANGYDPDLRTGFTIMPDAVERFGLLSEAIQVEAAIALDQISRNGMHIDLERLQALEAEHRRRLRQLVDRFQLEYPGHFKTARDGSLKTTSKTGAPQRSDKLLAERLLGAVKEITDSGETFEIPRNASGGVSLSTKQWADHLESHPFFRLWRDYDAGSKLVPFFTGLNQAVINPRYDVLKRTGRTSCSRPNVQQIPRSDSFRELFVATLGCFLLSVDYRYIELVTLAAICEARFGKSRLAEVIREGIDPHCFTAAMILGVPLEEFMSWQHSDEVVEVDGHSTKLRERFKATRQLAKPINFGVPGGLTPRALVSYARSKYKVEMTQEQAESFHQRLTGEIYPELGRYLDDWSISRLASRLGIHESICWDAFSWNGERSPAIPKSIRKIVEGRAFKADGTPYDAAYVRRVWNTLNTLARDPELQARLKEKKGDRGLGRELFGGDRVTSLTGRVRAGVSYTEERNTGFQGLASDGAKRALGRLIVAGYRVVGFVHDEILIELADQGGYVELAEIERVISIIREAMEEMTLGIPVSCEYALSTCWSKEARQVVVGDRVIPWRHDSRCSDATPRSAP
jgi:hypothetical protein